MKIFNKVAIVGTGLIGGSMGLAIKKNKLAGSIVGVSRHENSIVRAKRLGAIDNGSKSLAFIKDVDLIILATPVSVIMDLALRISKIINKNCTVIDVGSTKEKIALKLSKIFPNYVGTHPLAGSEKHGVAFASAGLFQGSLCILTPDKKTNKNILLKVKKLWQGVGAKTWEVNASEHDRIMAFVSHLPHAAAFALMNSVPEVFLKFSASGLKDTTRISASEPKLWADIFLSNDRNLLLALESLVDNLERIKLTIKNKNKNTLIKILRKAKRIREKLK
ncbi:MAG: prephenate dehydrogenase [Candidatus Omnitrophota bacterium]